MASALTDSGATRRWRTLRAHCAQQLPLPCPYCGIMIQPGEPFDLDHAVPRSSGGGDDQVRPAHSRRNRQAGIAIPHAQHGHRKTPEHGGWRVEFINNRAYLAWTGRICDKERKRERYATDPEYRERALARSREQRTNP